MNSNIKKAIQYSLTWFFNDLFQHNNTQIGIKNAVKSIIIKPKPSIPKTRFILIEFNQLLLQINWKSKAAESKKNNNKHTMFKINNDQNNENFRINMSFVLFTKQKTIQGTTGNKLIIHNIKT